MLAILDWGFLYTWCVFFGILSIVSMITLVQSYSLKSGRATHMILFTFLTIGCLGFFIGNVCSIMAVKLLTKVPPTLEDFNLGQKYIGAFTVIFNIGASCFNSMIVYQLFMWVELFVGVKYGNLSEQKKNAQRYLLIRTFLACALFIIGMVTGNLGVQNNIVDKTKTTASILSVAAIVVPVMILAGIRWKSLYPLMSQTKNSQRFFELTRASVIAICAWILEVGWVWYAIAQPIGVTVEVAVLCELLPFAGMSTSIIYHFTPMRKTLPKQSPSTATPPTSKVTVSADNGAIASITTVTPGAPGVDIKQKNNGSSSVMSSEFSSTSAYSSVNSGVDKDEADYESVHVPSKEGEVNIEMSTKREGEEKRISVHGNVSIEIGA